MDIFDYDKLFSFVREHAGEDHLKLRLKYRDAGDSVSGAITHLQCLDKAGGKFIASDGTDLTPRLFVSPLSVEQATAADIAMFHASLVTPGSRVLDMTAGLGIDARAISRVSGVDVTICEMNQVYADCLKYNFADCDNVTVVAGDSVSYLLETDRHYDLIFIDPARRGSEGQRVYNLHDCTPDLTEILPELLSHAPKVMAKLSPMLDVTQTIRDLDSVSRLYVVDDGHECKELFAVMERGSEGEPEIVAVSGDMKFSFTLSAEREAVVRTGVPEAGMVLYEPSPAMMKAAPFKLITARHPGFAKLADNTNLYVAEQPVDILPGRFLRIIETLDFSSSNIKRFAARYPRINVTSRNFPMSVDQLYKKLHVSQGGSLRLFATTLADGSRIMIVATEDLK